MQTEYRARVIKYWCRTPVERQRQLLQEYERKHGDGYTAEAWIRFIGSVLCAADGNGTAQRNDPSDAGV